MKTFTWQAICFAGALAALVSFPHVSSAAQDCSFGGVISPPLPADVGECIATGAIKAKGTLDVTEDATGGEFDVEDGMTLRIYRSGSSPGDLLIELGAAFDAGVFGEETLVSEPIVIEAAGEIHNGGVLSLVAPSDSIRLRAGSDITLHGDADILNAAQVKLVSGGDITLVNANITSRTNTVDIVASGDILVSESTLSAKDGKGKCRFTVGGDFMDGGDNTYHCIVVVNGVVVNP
jgi:hypothetical protein